MSTTQRQVMAAIAAIYIARTIASPVALKIYAILISLWGIGRLAWVSKVFENFFAVEKSGAAAVGNFILAAVEHAHFGVQVALVVAVVAAVSLFFDIRPAAPRGRSFAA